LLRVPPVLAAEWRRRCLQQAEQAGAQADEATAALLPLGRDENLYPGLKGSVRAAGLRAGVALDPRVGSPTDSDLRVLANIASVCLWFLDHDPQLRHCLRNVFRFGVTPLTDEQRERYMAELLRLWERLGQAMPGRQAAAGRQEWKDWLRLGIDF